MRWLEFCDALRKMLVFQSSFVFASSAQKYIGLAIGWISAVVYLCSRVPQVVKNVRRGSVEGLSILMFICTVMGNLTYGCGIMIHVRVVENWVLLAVQIVKRECGSPSWNMRGRACRWLKCTMCNDVLRCAAGNCLVRHHRCIAMASRQSWDACV